MLSELEKKIVAAIQGDIPISPQPYRELAQSLGVEEHVFIDTLQGLVDRGVVRRFGATLRHQMSGFKANAMVAWKIPEDRVDEVGEIFAGFAGVSHCYCRPMSEAWPYNLYTMIHAKDREQCHLLAKYLGEKAQSSDYSLLFSLRELKKTSMEYFPTDDDD